jgi:hypothetical protein
MLDPKTVLFGLSIKHIVDVCGVDVTTARRWKRGAICPPQSALAILTGDLGFLDPAWRGWNLIRGHLVSPENWEISINDVLASRLKDAQVRAYQAEVRKLRYELAEAERGGYEDQPTVDQWELEILVG